MPTGGLNIRWPDDRYLQDLRLQDYKGYAAIAFARANKINRVTMTKILEAVRQLRGEAHPKVQVKNCDLAIAHGTGGLLGVRHASSTCILERV